MGLDRTVSEGATCPDCHGNGVGHYIYHGVESNGEACIEPIRCEKCDGIGRIFDWHQSSADVPYLYVYEYDTPFGLHREFYPTTYNGQEPTRAVPLFKK